MDKSYMKNVKPANQKEPGYQRIGNVRTESAAGWFSATIEISPEGELTPYEKTSGYYPTEELLTSEEPNTISIDEALERKLPFRRKKNEVKSRVVEQLRLQSAAGWYLGSIEVYSDGHREPYDRESDYYPSEEHLHKDYPHSSSSENIFF